MKSLKIMMRPIEIINISLLSLAVCLSCASCRKADAPGYEKKQANQIRLWDGRNFKINEIGYPVTIIWFKTGGGDFGSAYKSFSQFKEIQQIMELLGRPDETKRNPQLRTQNKLSLIFYRSDEQPRVVELYFTIAEDGVFIDAAGKSREIGKILLEKETFGPQGLPLFDDEQYLSMEKAKEQFRKSLSSSKVKDINSRPE